MKKLLLIIDTQKKFVPDDRSGEDFSSRIEQLQKEYKNIAISKFINNPDTFWVRFLKWDKMMEGESSTELAFRPKEGAFIYKNDTFSSINKELLDYLEKASIEEVHICGMDTDACILATAFDLWDRKIPFKILINYCLSAAGHNIHSSAQHLMNKNFGFDIVVSNLETNTKHS